MACCKTSRGPWRPVAHYCMRPTPRPALDRALTACVVRLAQRTGRQRSRRHGGARRPLLGYAPVGDTQRGGGEDDRPMPAPRKEEGQRCSRVDDRLRWCSVGTYARVGEERSKAAVGARRGMTVMHRGSSVRRTVSGRGRRLNGDVSCQRSSVHDGSTWREEPEVVTSERGNDFRQGTSNRLGRGALIPAHVDRRRPRGLS
jgi:hypothetical protein